MIVLVVGGTRSGKSEVAERLASDLGEPVTYLATARPAPADDDFRVRIAAHRARRRASWRTLEEPFEIGGALGAAEGTVIVDALGTWIANARDFKVDIGALCAALRARRGDTVVVSEEVGMSLLPVDDLARRFVDALGDCNRAVASVADRVLLVVAGRTIELEAF